MLYQHTHVCAACTSSKLHDWQNYADLVIVFQWCNLLHFWRKRNKRDIDIVTTVRTPVCAAAVAAAAA